MLVVNMSLIRQQVGEAALGAVAVRVVGTLAAAYAADPTSPHRRTALVAAGVLLVRSTLSPS